MPELTDGCPKCAAAYEWVEEPGDQSRILEWARDCPRCHYSPDCSPGDRSPMTYTVEDEYSNVKLITDDFQRAYRLAVLNDWWMRDETAVALFGREDDEE
jgi:hypothetical protein